MFSQASVCSRGEGVGVVGVCDQGVCVARGDQGGVWQGETRVCVTGGVAGGMSGGVWQGVVTKHIHLPDRRPHPQDRGPHPWDRGPHTPSSPRQRTPPPPRTEDHTTPRPMVNPWAVRILLESILVTLCIDFTFAHIIGWIPSVSTACRTQVISTNGCVTFSSGYNLRRNNNPNNLDL